MVPTTERKRCAVRSQPLILSLFGIVLASLLALPATALVFRVNSVLDRRDLVLGDGLCRTGFAVPNGTGGFVNECTFRAAIEESNASSGRDLIDFSSPLIYDATNVALIEPASDYPDITDAVDIDGTTAPAYVGGGSPRVLIRRVSFAWGLFLSTGSADTTIRGLAFQGFGSTAIIAWGSDGAWIDSCAFGYFAPSLPGFGNVIPNSTGIAVLGPPNTTIGAKISGQAFVGFGNVISGNLIGISVLGDNTSIVGNMIGTDRTGSRTTTLGVGDPLGNEFGIIISGGAGIQIGRTILRAIGQPPFLEAIESRGNVISGNLSDGISIVHQFALPGPLGISLEANRIGTDLAGTTALGNGLRGININRAAVPISIGTLFGDPNIISGNQESGIEGTAVPGPEVIIRGNHIGVDVTGTVSIGNSGDGIELTGVSPVSVLSNVIGGNGRAGISTSVAFPFVPDKVILSGNWIGTNASSMPVPNTGAGILIASDLVEVRDNIIGKNAIGIDIGVNGTQALLQGNFIGTDLAGSNLGNLGAGIRVDATEGDVSIGSVGAGNVIGWNGESGIRVLSAENENRIVGNWIGVHPTAGAIPNGLHGIRVTNDPALPVTPNRFVQIGADLTIPSTQFPDYENRIAHNMRDGVSVNDQAWAVIRGNRIRENGELAIDLGSDGPTANDFGDVDAGANRLQNYPVFNASASSFNPVTGYLALDYQVTTNVANASYPLTIDFYLADATGLQPFRYLGSDSYPAPRANLFRAITFQPATPIPSGLQRIVATATDDLGNTSEVSAPVVVPEPRASLGLALGALGLVGFSSRRRPTWATTPAMERRPVPDGCAPGPDGTRLRSEPHRPSRPISSQAA